MKKALTVVMFLMLAVGLILYFGDLFESCSNSPSDASVYIFCGLMVGACIISLVIGMF